MKVPLLSAHSSPSMPPPTPTPYTALDHPAVFLHYVQFISGSDRMWAAGFCTMDTSEAVMLCNISCT